MKQITPMIFLTFLCVVSAAPCNTSYPSSLYESKMRYSGNRKANKDTGIENGINASTRRRGGRGGSGSGKTRPVSSAGSGISSNDDDGGEECFPGSASVNVLGKGVIKMSELRIGDKVKTTKGFSPVYMFSHRITTGKYEFIRVITDSGEIIVSAGHYVFSRGGMVTAGGLKIGDALEKEDGGIAKVVGKEFVERIGLYNPHSLDGELVVDGMRVSVYTKTVDPTFANCLLSPIRAAFRAFGVDVTGGVLNSDVSDTVVQVLPKGYTITGA